MKINIIFSLSNEQNSDRIYYFQQSWTNDDQNSEYISTDFLGTLDQNVIPSFSEEEEAIECTEVGIERKFLFLI